MDNFTQYTNQDGEKIIRVSSSELQQNMKSIINLIKKEYFIEITKHKKSDWYDRAKLTRL